MFSTDSEVHFIWLILHTKEFDMYAMGLNIKGNSSAVNEGTRIQNRKDIFYTYLIKEERVTN